MHNMGDVPFSRHDDGRCTRCGYNGLILHFHVPVVDDCISSCRHCAPVGVNLVEYVIGKLTKDKWTARAHRSELALLMKIREEAIKFSTEAFDASTRYLN